MRILGREGEDPRVSGLFFKAAVQVVFVFGSDTWFLVPFMYQSLGSFQHKVAQQISGRHLRRRG